MNKLGEEKSPYLLQHAANPVNWYPWGEQAFEAARESNKLIFLSVGYSTCHWCHVMERESFENQEVAEIMNEHFINVKVDREERPDVDKVYMSFVQATTGGGGWPMSVFLTPTLKPIYGGTYFPPEDQRFGRPGFKTILEALSSKWENQRDMMIQSGDKIIQAMEKSTMSVSEDENSAGSAAKSPPNGEIVAKTCFGQLLQNYDSDMGGFSKAPKFPQPVNFNFLFTYYAANPKDDKGKQGLKMALHTLDMMARGGIHDHISQGFARYSTDANWHVPHFEKMLYDQAQLSVAYSFAYQATKEEKFSAIVEDILTYVKRDLGHPLGAFYSAEDADSKACESDEHKREGAFCVWTHQQLTTLLKKNTFQGNDKKEHNLLEICEAYFKVKPGGNVDPRGDPHGELKNQNHLTTIGIDEIEKIVADFGLENEAALLSKVKEIQEILYAERQKRPRPHLDNKILTSWNGLMISGFAVSGMALLQKRPEYIEIAVQAAEFVRTRMYDEDKGTLLRSIYSGSDGNVEQLKEPIHGFADDYAFLIQGLLDLYQATFDEKWIEWADQLQTKQNELFWDEKGHGYFTAPEDEELVLRLKEDQDGAEPSANSISSLNLLRLFAYTENKKYREMAGQLFNSYETTLTRMPLALPALTSGLLMFHKSPLQIIIAGPEKEAKPLIEAVHKLLLPQKILIRAPAENAQETSMIYKRLEVLKDIPTKEAKAYVCRNYACSQPVDNPEALIKLILEE